MRHSHIAPVSVSALGIDEVETRPHLDRPFAGNILDKEA
ncbi:MAG: hypothetical protein OJF49_002929 [Ktedonobacterales bacterium]|nr:MAG: hypothetical protein OJF49_002929 [Ktedonobacterales bacterium]